MGDELYKAMREYVRVAVELEVRKAVEVRAAPAVIEGPSGKPGVDGSAGKDGKNGQDGIAGKDGKDGAPGIGERGADGIAGKDGKDGAPSTVPGPKGDAGERGADGIATREEIVAIVEERAADINVRSFADVYQGVYENGKLYTRGLLTTWGGSLFLSKADTKARPGESQDWQLVVKRGADGKDVGNRR